MRKPRGHIWSAMAFRSGARCSKCGAERETVRWGPKAGVRYRLAGAMRWRKTEPKCVEEKKP